MEYLCNVSSTEHSFLTVHRLHVGRLQIGLTYQLWMLQRRFSKAFQNVTVGATFPHGGSRHNHLLISYSQKISFSLFLKEGKHAHFGGSKLNALHSCTLPFVIYTLYSLGLGAEAVGIGEVTIEYSWMLGNINLVEKMTT